MSCLPGENFAAAEEARRICYDVQFIVQGENLNVNVIRSAIDAMGWSTVVVGDEAP
jgi:hypothetical protein